ncbi:MAG: hypothetical protein ACREL1_04245 [bacterium]
MEGFKGYLIAVPIIMILVLGLIFYLRGLEASKATGIFFLGWIMGAISMFIKAWLVYKR